MDLLGESEDGRMAAAAKFAVLGRCGSAWPGGMPPPTDIGAPERAARERKDKGLLVREKDKVWCLLGLVAKTRRNNKLC